MSFNNAIPVSSQEQLEQLVEHFSKHPNVWSPRSVKDEPKITMQRWSIYEVMTEHYGERTRHLVGYTGEGRVSSKVVNWELVEEGILATTNSGRKYLLAGMYGNNMDASYVWNVWTNRHGATNIEDVTLEYWDKEKDAPKLPTRFPRAAED